MTYDQFWRDDPWLAKSYRRAYELQIEKTNQELWLQGLYFHNAVAVAINNAFNKQKQKYINKPLQMFQPTKDEREAQIRENNRKLVERLNRFKDEFEARQRKQQTK